MQLVSRVRDTIDKRLAFLKKYEQKIEDIERALFAVSGAVMIYVSASIFGVHGDVYAQAILKAGTPSVEELGYIIELIKVLYFLMGVLMWIGIMWLTRGVNHFARKWKKKRQRRERVCLP